MNLRRHASAFAITALVAVGAGCTPEEIQQWVDWHAAEPEAATAALLPSEVPGTDVEVSAPPTAKIVQGNPNGYYVAAATSCPAAVTITNTDVGGHTYLIQFGPHQFPLTGTTNGELPVIGGAESLTIDLRPAAGERATLFIDGGAMWQFDDIAC
jgi:hypothetical protein